MASDGTYIYYNDGYGGNNEIYQLNSSGAVVSSGNPVPDGEFTGLAYLNGSLYGADVDGDVYQINPNTWTVTGLFSQPALYPLVGLAGDPDNGELYAVTSGPRAVRDRPHHRRGPGLGARRPESLRARPGLFGWNADRLRRKRCRRTRQQLPGRIQSEHLLPSCSSSPRPTPTRPRAWPATVWAAAMPTGTRSTSTPATTW